MTGLHKQTRQVELLRLLLVQVLVMVGVLLLGSARTREWPTVKRGLGEGSIINLNRVLDAETLAGALHGVEAAGDRSFAATSIVRGIGLIGPGALTHIGALARITTDTGGDEEGAQPGSIRERLARTERDARGRAPRVPVLSAEALRESKPYLIVRELREFRATLWRWAAVWAAGFWLVHLVWRRWRFGGDTVILPALALLTGIGFLILTGLRDPFRDTLLFANFAQGTALGCAILLAASFVDYQQLATRFTFLPLLLSFALSIALLLFGHGPGVSDAKVNLGPFQPAEAIRVLLIFFLAGYLSRRWRLLREVREQRWQWGGGLRWFAVPKLEDLVPVLAGVGLALLFFFLQKDLGPALIMICVFLSLYGIARGRAGLVLLGLVLIAGGIGGGLLLGVPRVFVQRVEMMQSPWNNPVAGGEQVAAGLWAMSSGGMGGAGMGMGEANLVPAAHTDLILAATGEELGFAGVLAVVLLWCLAVGRAARAALLAPTIYLAFLALGVVLAVSFQMALIASGTLGLAPLSGVVAPFLSYGRSAMVANFALFGIVLAVSAQRKSPDPTRPLHGPARVAFAVLGAVGIAVVCRAAWVQVWAADEYATRAAMVRQADGAVRAQQNPRLVSLARRLGRGDIVDRNGLPLATSRYDEVSSRQEQYSKVGIPAAENVRPGDARYYPLGAAGHHLLGDLRTRRNWDATNTAFVERTMEATLLGFGGEVPDRRIPLVRLWRHRFEPAAGEWGQFTAGRRDVQLTVDAGFMVRVLRILQSHLQQSGKIRGAVVVVDARSGEVLATVSAPLPEDTGAGGGVEGGLFDRARYGLYAPGSTFKLVTAIAALRAGDGTASRTFACERLADGRVGAMVRGEAIRDDVTDKRPHGAIGLNRAMAVSCNAYFANLAVAEGAKQLFGTARLFGINAPQSGTRLLPQSGYGQGDIVATPFQMARVAATVANGGRIPFLHWISKPEPERGPEVAALTPEQAELLGAAMREVVTDGTGRAVAAAPVPVAGKTGTAEISGGTSHAWFAGFAPYGRPGRRIAFCVFIENGGYGGSAAALLAADVVAAAVEAGLIRR
jgi:cell division protein FtsW (lipid II flippase)/cell division protein FtsI/penicillin-binding protein 2